MASWSNSFISSASIGMPLDLSVEYLPKSIVQMILGIVPKRKRQTFLSSATMIG